MEIDVGRDWLSVKNGVWLFFIDFSSIFLPLWLSRAPMCTLNVISRHCNEFFTMNKFRMVQSKFSESEAFLTV